MSCQRERKARGERNAENYVGWGQLRSTAKVDGSVPDLSVKIAIDCEGAGDQHRWTIHPFGRVWSYTEKPYFTARTADERVSSACSSLSSPYSRVLILSSPLSVSPPWEPQAHARPWLSGCRPSHWCAWPRNVSGPCNATLHHSSLDSRIFPISNSLWKKEKDS